MDRRIWIVAFLLGAVLLSAVLLWWFIGDAPEGSERAPRRDPPRATAPEPSLETRTAKTRAPGGESPGDVSGAASDSGAAGTVSSAVVAWLDVRVRCEAEHEIQESVRAYALRAGDPGAEGTYELPHAVLDLNGEAVRIPLLRPGRYDVGAVCDWGHALREDVEVQAGAIVPVELALEPPGVVQVRLNDTWPMDGFPNVRGWVVLKAAATPRRRPAPGRGEAYEPLCACAIWSDMQGVRVPQGVPYDATLRFVRPVRGYATEVIEFEPRAASIQLEPARVRAGDRIQLGLPELTALPIRIRVKGAWPPGGVTNLRVEVRGPHWVSSHDWYRELDAPSFSKEENSAIRPLVPGDVEMSVHWSGSAIRPGSLERVDLLLRAGTPIEIPLVFDDSRVGPSLPVSVDVTRPAKTIRMTAWRKGAKPPLRHRMLPASGRREVPGQWRAFQHLFAYTDDGRITHPATIPATGGVELAWMQGGYVQIEGAAAYPDEAGALVLRRLDGAPFVAGERVELEEYVEEGERLGPLRPGVIGFELLAGRERLGVYRVTIRPGKVSPLRIRR